MDQQAPTPYPVVFNNLTASHIDELRHAYGVRCTGHDTAAGWAVVVYPTLADGEREFLAWSDLFAWLDTFQAEAQ